MLRAVFRIVFDRFERCRASTPFSARVSASHWQEFRPAVGGKRQMFGFRNEEFVADVVAIAKRALGGVETRAWRAFRLHFLEGRDWTYCAPRVGLNRGNWFHEVYRIQEALGRAFRETRPHALFPLDEYFAEVVRR